MPAFRLAASTVRRMLLIGAVASVTLDGGFSAAHARRASGQQPSAPAAAAAEDDPFADELNPFGTGKAAKPRPAPAAATPPAAADAERRREPDTDTDTDAEPRPAPRTRARPKLPVPFPEAPADDATTQRRDRAKDRTERLPQSGGGLGRPQQSAADDWVDRSEAEKLLAEAEKLEQAGRLEEARDLLRRAVAEDPSLVVGHLALGVVLRRLDDFPGAVEACTKGLAIDPQEPELYLRRGIAWFHQGLYGIALEDFEEAAGIAYDDPRPELWRGLALIELQRPLEAINAYASAIRRDRGFRLAYLNRGLAYLGMGEPGKAEFDFNQAIRQQPKDPTAWVNRGVAQARQGRFREAVFSYETALGFDPNDAAARRNLEAARGMAARSATPAGRTNGF